MFRKLLNILFFSFFALIVLPVAAGAALAYQKGWAPNWHSADWSSAGILPDAASSPEAEVYVMAGRSGRWKGIFAVHHWLVVKPKNATRYDRYEVVGWGTPVRRNAYDPDGRWYSSEPEIVHRVSGLEAEIAIPKLVEAVRGYNWSTPGEYVVWPGPNSNTFIATLGRKVPELELQMDPAGVGKDWLGEGFKYGPMPSGTGYQVSYNGLIGVGLAAREGIELHFLGSTIGIDFDDVAIKLPALGKIGFL